MDVKILKLYFHSRRVPEHYLMDMTYQESLTVQKTPLKIQWLALAVWNL